MKKLQLQFKEQIIQMIIRMMIILFVFGLFSQVGYSQIATTTPASRCGEGPLVLGATATSGTIKWYTVPFYGTAVATGGTFTTPSLVVTTTYYVDAVDAGNCSLNTNQARVPVIATVSASSIQAAVFYSSNTFCKSLVGAQDVTRTGTAGGTYSAAAGLTLNSSTGAITPSSSTNGTYTVTYHITTPADGCTENDATTQVTITTTPVTPVIRYAETPTTPISYCTTAGTISVTHTGASGGTYSASPTGLTIDASTGTITTATSLSGTYTATYFVPGLGGCDAMTAQATGITILQLPTAAISYASSAHSYFTINQGTQLVSLTGTGVYTGGVYSTTTGLTIDGTSGTITPASSTAGTYTVSYTLASVSPCGAPAVATTTVTIYPLPTANIAGTIAVCENSSSPDITFTGANGTSPYTFTYKLNDGSDLTITTTSGNSATVSQTSALDGIYTYTLVSVSDAHGSWQNQTGTATITVTNEPEGEFFYAATPYCSNGTDPLPTYLEGGVAGTFSSTGGLVFISASTGQIDLSASTAGTYTVTNTVSGLGGCTNAMVTSVITITALPVATFSYVDSPYCSNAGPQTATLGSGATAGVFTSTPGLVFLNTATGQVDLAASLAGTYTVTNTVAAANGCGEVSATSSIQIDNATTVGATYFDYGSIFSRCQAAGTVTFHAAAENATSIIYTLDATTAAHTGNSINSGTGEVTFAADWTGTGSEVTATSTAHCGNTTSEHIIINTNPNVVVGPTTFTLGATSSRCQDAGAVTYAATATNSNSITYQLDDASTAGGNSISQFTGDVTYVAGWYGTTTISASATISCGNTTTNTHTVTTYPTTVGGSIAGSTTVCTGANSTVLTLSGETGTIQKWQYSSDNFSSDVHDIVNTSNSNTAADLTVTTYYRAQVKSGDCSAAYSNIATVTVVPDPSIDTQPTNPATICAGGTSADMTIVASNGTPSLTYQWQYNNDGTWENVANSTPAGATYTGATATTFSVSGISGAGTYQYKCIVSASGSGCGDATSSTVTVTVVADPTLSQPDNASICLGGSTTLTTVASNGTGTYSYQWQYSANGTTGWANVADATPTGITYSGNTSASLVITGSGTEAAQANYYKCVLTTLTPTGAGCDATTTAVTVTSVALPIVSAQPAATQSNCLDATPTNLTFAATGGAGSFSYQWYSNSSASTSGASLISGATSGTYTPPTAVAGTTYYYCIITQAGNGCGTLTSNFAEVIVYNQFTSGEIATTGQTICYAGTPTEIGSTTDASGGHGTITYQWQSSVIGDFTDAVVLSGSNAATYTPADGLTVTTSYRRYAYDVTCNPAPTQSTGTWTVTVNPLPTVVITDPAVCFSPGTVDLAAPAVTVGSTVGLTFTYWTNPEATIEYEHYYDATAGTYYIKGTTDFYYCYEIKPVTVTVYNQFTTGAIANTGQTICYAGTPSLIGNTTAASGGNGTITYQWQSSVIGDFTDAVVLSGSNAATYTPAAGLTVTTSYRRYAHDGTCNTSFEVSTGTWVVTVHDNFTPGAILTTNETICYNGDPAVIGSSTASSGGDQTITYKWESSLDGFATAGSVIDGATSASYNPPTGLTATTSYRRYAHDGTCNTSFEVSTGTWVVTVQDQAPTAGAIATDQTICYNTAPALLTSGTAGTGGTGATITYEWQTNATGSYVTIPSATGATYQPPTLTATTSYQRRTVSTLNGNACNSAYTTAIAVTVDPNFTPGAILTTGQSICYNGDPSVIGNSTASTGGDGTITYKWESSLDGFATAGSVIDGATSASYNPPTGLTATTSYRRYAHDGTCNTSFEVSTGTWLVTINPLPTITTDGIAVAVTYNASEQTTTLAYTATTNTPVSYSIDWTGMTDQNSTSITFESGSGSVTGIIIPAGTEANTYNGTMTIVNGNGCTVTQAVTVTVN